MISDGECFIRQALCYYFKLIFMIFHFSKVMSRIFHTRIHLAALVACTCLLLTSCLPKDSIKLKDVQNLMVVPGTGTDPVLKGDALFFNPNKTRMKLKSIQVDVFIDEKKTATVDQDLNIVVKGESEFSVPLTVRLQLKDLGLVNALVSLLGGKTYQVHYVGTLKVNVNGLPFKIPIDHKEEFKLKI
jgi:LEA14-like dessication related protein